MTREDVLGFLKRQADYDLGFNVDEEAYFREAIYLIENSVLIDHVVEIIDDEMEQLPSKALRLRPLLYQGVPDLNGELWVCLDIKERVAALKGGDKK